MGTDSRLDRAVYRIGWCLLGLAVLYVLLARAFQFSVFKYQIPCLFHRVTGYYCPGCGGTRAVRALLAFRIADSIRYHPIVPYGALLGGWFMVSQTIERLSRGRVQIGMRCRNIYLWIAVAILAVNVLVKNLLLGVWQIDLLSY